MLTRQQAQDRTSDSSHSGVSPPGKKKSSQGTGLQTFQRQGSLHTLKNHQGRQATCVYVDSIYQHLIEL